MSERGHVNGCDGKHQNSVPGRAGSMTLGLVGPMEKPRLPQRVCASSCSDGMAANKQQHNMVLILSHCSSAAGDTAVCKRTRFRMNTHQIALKATQTLTHKDKAHIFKSNYWDNFIDPPPHAAPLPPV